jgi:branched-chain amino acid transport system substrate-binding protein
MVKKITLTVIMALFLLSYATIVLSKDGVNASKKEIAIAGMDAVTGKFGEYGTSNKRGQEFAVAEINEAGGIASGPLKGYKLKLDFYDDQGDPKESASIARKISSMDYLVVIGETMSSCALAQTPVLFKQRFPAIITYSNAATITEQGFDNIIRLTYTTKSVAYDMADTVVKQFKKSKVSIINENVDYGQQLLKSFQERIKNQKYNIQIVSQDTVAPGQDVDFRDVLIKAKAKQPDMVILFLEYNEGGMVVRQTRSMGWQIPIYAAGGLAEPKFFELAGELGEFYLNMPRRLKLVGKFVEGYEAQYKVKPPEAATYGYDGVKITAKTIEMGGVDHESFIKKMRQVKIPGLGNPVYEFDKVGDIVKADLYTLTGEEYKKEYLK